MIRVKPERSLLVAFARWATAQTPKVRTAGLGEFAVPAALFVHAPEEVLIGALVDGHRYVSPSEDRANGLPEPGDYQEWPEPLGEELLGVAVPGLEFAPLEDALTDGPELLPDAVPAPVEDVQGRWACPVCPREFTTERGRDSHRRQVHKEA